MEPPAYTGYQKCFVTLEGNAVCLTSSASPAEGKTLPYQRDQQTRYSHERYTRYSGFLKTSRRRVLISVFVLLCTERNHVDGVGSTGDH